MPVARHTYDEATQEAKPTWSNCSTGDNAQVDWSIKAYAGVGELWLVMDAASVEAQLGSPRKGGSRGD